MSVPYQFNVEKIISEERVDRTHIEQVKAWLKTTTLPQIQDEMIALFLLGCANNVAAVPDSIVKYFKIKSGGPQIFKGRNIEDPALIKAMEMM